MDRRVCVCVCVNLPYRLCVVCDSAHPSPNNSSGAINSLGSCCRLPDRAVVDPTRQGSFVDKLYLKKTAKETLKLASPCPAMPLAESQRFSKMSDAEFEQEQFVGPCSIFLPRIPPDFNAIQDIFCTCLCLLAASSFSPPSFSSPPNRTDRRGR